MVHSIAEEVRYIPVRELKSRMWKREESRRERDRQIQETEKASGARAVEGERERAGGTKFIWPN